ncbi:GyrI-like domain-containing protein [Paraburkholderia sp. J12]|uniref:AraC family transcriptional regulator n=1 Tax=Paraburkholderia sp. J12 TaxID=2805432 RepID=UPI002ABD84D2|nr:GyrI-like domain-containing protein [Paraburkholderia sp. J12]
MQASDVKIVTLQPMDLLAVEHIGPYPKIGDAYATLAQWLGQRNVSTAGSTLVGIFYDDPDRVEASKLRSKAAIQLAEPSSVAPASPVQRMALRGGKHAVLLHKGPYEGLKAAWMGLYAEWLPNSGHQADFNVPSFEVYRNTPDEVAPEALLTELCLPLV